MKILVREHNRIRLRGMYDPPGDGNGWLNRPAYSHRHRPVFKRQAEVLNAFLSSSNIKFSLPPMDTEAKIPAYKFPAILKIGRYIAITRPQIVTPRKTNINGSIKEVRFSTAWSTSSS